MIGRRPATLADRHARASLRANVAIVSFTETANALDATAEELDFIAAEARNQGNALLTQAAQAQAEATHNIARAGKIRALIGATP